MGVSGAGKTTIGRRVAERLGWDFLDADALHSLENVEKMRRGEGLTDADRALWLAALRERIEVALAAEAPLVLACSALRAEYRRQLAQDDPRVRVVWLDAAPETLRDRLTARAGHYAGAALLPSQLAALEPPERDEAARVAADAPVDAVVDAVLAVLRA